MFYIAYDRYSFRQTESKFLLFDSRGQMINLQKNNNCKKKTVTCPMCVKCDVCDDLHCEGSVF